MGILLVFISLFPFLLLGPIIFFTQSNSVFCIIRSIIFYVFFLSLLFLAASRGRYKRTHARTRPAR